MDTGGHSGGIDLSHGGSERLTMIYGNCGYWAPMNVAITVTDMNGDLDDADYYFEVEP